MCFCRATIRNTPFATLFFGKSFGKTFGNAVRQGSAMYKKKTEPLELQEIPPMRKKIKKNYSFLKEFPKTTISYVDSCPDGQRDRTSTGSLHFAPHICFWD